MKLIKEGELVGHGGAVYALCNAPVMGTIFTGGADKIVAQWDIESKKALGFSIKVDASIYALCYLNELNFLAIGLSTGGIHLIDLTKKTEIKYFTYHSKAIYKLLYNTTSKELYAASGDGSFSVWDMINLKHKRTLYLCDAKIRGLALDNNNNKLAVACGDTKLRIFETTHFNELVSLSAHKDAVNTVVFNPNNNSVIYSGGKDAHLIQWNLDAEKEQIDSIPAHNYAIYGISFTKTGHHFATVSRDKNVKIWETANNQVIQRLDWKNHKGHKHSVNNLLWINGEEKLITVSDDKSIIVWKKA